MTNYKTLGEEYNRLKSISTTDDATEKRNRGFEFERLLKRLFELDDLDPRSSYRTDGEQIDGSIKLDGRYCLIEAKWHADPLPASVLYQFKGKVDGKLVGTIGIFISMSGYASDAVDALTLGKDLSLILLDSNDIDVAILKNLGIKAVLDVKLRTAAEEGVIYFPVQSKLVKPKRDMNSEINSLQYDSVTNEAFGRASIQPPITSDLLIVCEGDIDRVIISTLCKRILSESQSRRSIQIIAAMGKMSIPRVAIAALNTFASKPRLLIVADGDDEQAQTEAAFAKNLDHEQFRVVLPNPTIESWLGLDVNSIRRWGMQHRIRASEEAVEQIDLEKLKFADKEFAKFYEAIART